MRCAVREWVTHHAEDIRPPDIYVYQQFPAEGKNEEERVETIADEHGKRSAYLKEQMLRLPVSSGYSHFFDERYIERLNYHLYEERRNSLRNLKRK